MFRVFLSLFRIAKEVRRIREILEIVFAKELELHTLVKSYGTLNPNEVEIDTTYIPKVDAYGEVIPTEEDET